MSLHPSNQPCFLPVRPFTLLNNIYTSNDQSNGSNRVRPLYYPTSRLSTLSNIQSVRPLTRSGIKSYFLQILSPRLIYTILSAL